MTRPLREATLIAVAGCLLGLMYTGVTGKGLFSADPPPTAVPAGNEPEYIEYANVLALHRSGGALILDSRHDFDYELGHIAGAVNLPLKEFDERRDLWRSWPKDTVIITYCDGQECNSSMELASKLAAAGFQHVRFFFDGWNEWAANGGPTERTRE